MNKYEALETMLENIFEHGTDMETVLAEFPEFAEELRPFLESAIDVNALTVPSASADVVRRERTRLLKHAAKMRDSAPALRSSFFDFRFAAVTLALLLVFFVGGTGIVQASTSALPGDGLYPVKRGWENARFWFATEDKAVRLAAEYEEERREEVKELLGGRRLAMVHFEGLVTLMNRSNWEVAGVPVIVSKETDVDDAIQIGSDVIVTGQTQSNGTVFATKIVLSGHSEEHQDVSSEESNVSETETPADDDDDDLEITETPEPEEEDDDDNDDSKNDDDDEGDSNDEKDNTPESDADDDTESDDEADEPDAPDDDDDDDEDDEDDEGDEGE